MAGDGRVWPRDGTWMSGLHARRSPRTTATGGSVMLCSACINALAGAAMAASAIFFHAGEMSNRLLSWAGSGPWTAISVGVQDSRSSTTLKRTANRGPRRNPRFGPALASAQIPNASRTVECAKRRVSGLAVSSEAVTLPRSRRRLGLRRWRLDLQRAPVSIRCRAIGESGGLLPVRDSFSCTPQCICRQLEPSELTEKRVCCGIRSCHRHAARRRQT
ncbi:hypothetical protein BU16DRAFT_603873, partial [Lophium mytilinum]